jgi:hypothetical protein
MKAPVAFAAALVLLTGLGLANWILSRAPLDVSVISGEDPKTALGQADAVLALADREINLLQASARPLFSPDRRPWSAPPPADLPTPSVLTPADPIPATSLPELTLIGIQKTPKGAKALLASKSGASPVWLSNGEIYQDWKIGDITATSATLANGASTITLEMYPPLAGRVTGP